MWPMTPVVHMTYRLWQLGRGSLLVGVLEGPVWLIYLQVGLHAQAGVLAYHAPGTHITVSYMHTGSLG